MYYAIRAPYSPPICPKLTVSAPVKIHAAAQAAPQVLHEADKTVELIISPPFSPSVEFSVIPTFYFGDFLL
jgi:hypothetical protein